MARRIAIIQGHPDSSANRYCRALAEAYAQGAQEAGHEVKRIDVAALDFPLLRSKAEFETGTVPACLRDSQDTIAWADHLLIVYPLWLGMMPGMLKAYLEQVFRPGFAFRKAPNGRTITELLAGRSARIVVTMGMPAFWYRWYFGVHGLKSLERNILGFCGIRPIRATLIGTVESLSDAGHADWLARLRALGRAAM